MANLTEELDEFYNQTKSSFVTEKGGGGGVGWGIGVKQLKITLPIFKTINKFPVCEFQHHTHTTLFGAWQVSCPNTLVLPSFSDVSADRDASSSAIRCRDANSLCVTSSSSPAHKGRHNVPFKKKK